MTRYRKRPIVIFAERWFENGDHSQDGVGEMVYNPMGGPDYERLEGKVVQFYSHPDAPGWAIHTACDKSWKTHGWIDTLEGGHNVCPGDWIITGVMGERYPCKPAIFEMTYELDGNEDDDTPVYDQLASELQGL